MKKSMVTILRAYMMYKPLKFFTFLMIPPTAVGLVFIIRYLVYVAAGTANGHVQSLILACTLLIMGFLTFTIGLVSDVVAANRRLLQDTQYHARRAEYDAIYAQLQLEQRQIRTYHVVGEAPHGDVAG